MTQDVSTIDVETLKTKELHDLMLAMPVMDDQCRFYGGYVLKGHKARFPDGTMHTCIDTETWDPAE
ncbi:hypothetical protein [Sphingomonas faeni]|uniref:hypothetical protein n=1 Tax=Sphingomonas faeni TaxID=185950 RepID=UPI00334EA679